MKGGHRGPAIEAGDAEGSLLMQAVRGAGGLKAMPPGAPLAATEVAILERWIQAGAVFPAPLPNSRGKALWSLEPLPAASTTPATSVDVLVEQGLRAKGLVASPAADRRTLIRRLSYDLTGLPPYSDLFSSPSRNAPRERASSWTGPQTRPPTRPPGLRWRERALP